MKEFKKWEDSNCNNRSCPETYNGKIPCNICEELRETGWRAALKWALSHKKPINYKDYKFDWIKTDIIEEELNE